MVIHAELKPTAPGGIADYSHITSLRNTGFIFLQSFNAEEAQDISLAAYAIAKFLQKPVVHFYTTSSENLSKVTKLDQSIISFILDASSNEVKSDADADADADSELESQETKNDLSSSEIDSVISNVFDLIKSKTSHSYSSFEYFGPSNAETLLVLFGSPIEPLKASISKVSSTKTGLLLVRVYRPWSFEKFNSIIPKSIKKIALLEQIVKQTTNWSPLLLDFISNLKSLISSGLDIANVVSFQLGSVTFANVLVVLKTINANLSSNKPIQNLYLGAKPISSKSSHLNSNLETIKQVQSLESAYIKILQQLYNDKLDLINSTSNDIGGLTNNPEYGFGKFLFKEEQKQKLINLVSKLINKNDFKSLKKDELINLLTKWSVEINNSSSSSTINKNIISDLSEKIVSLLSIDSSSSSKELLNFKDYFVPKSTWIIGSDSWSYDLGNSGVHNLIQSNKNLNILIIDSEPQSLALSKKHRKKDIGLYAMNYGNTYVSSVAIYSSYTQVLHSLIEAENFNGPSIVLAYLPYFNESDNAITILQETKKSIDSGYWPLYRWNPKIESIEKQFQLDSFRIKKELKDFLDRENKLSILTKKNPILSKNLTSSFGKEILKQQQKASKDSFSKLLQGLAGPPLTILYASDGGAAESLAKRLERRAKARSLRAIVMAMDDFPIDDLSTEENLILITSTAGQGEFPQNGRNFWDFIKNSTDLDLSSVKYSIFGLGDSLYWPRKEDKIYYNKPSKDLDVKFELYGASKLAPLGLGDEQDGDGYQTGYNNWEPEIWKALGVDNIETADEPPPITNEDMKLASNYLRGTIVEGLQDNTTGSISASDQQLTKFHGIYLQDDRDIRDSRKSQGLEPAYAFMVRCRLPGSVSTPQQWLKIDELSDSRGNGTFKITTRGTYQLHGVVKHDLKPAIRAINSTLMDTLGACGDVNRNVMCSALPTNQKVQNQAVKAATLISEYLLPQTTAYHEIWLEGSDDSDNSDFQKIFASRKDGPKKKIKIAGDAIHEVNNDDYEPLYGNTYLPRKFKINICVPPHNDIDVYSIDVGLIAIVDENDIIVGYNVLAGGGMGVTHNNNKTYPRAGSMFGYVEANQVHIVCKKIVEIQRDNGDRKNRKHARLKYTIDDMGIEVFKSKVEEIWGQTFQEPKPFTLDANVDYYGWCKDETGLNHFTCFIENGRVEDTPDLQQKTGLREIAKVLNGEFRLTGNQHVIISNVTDEQLPQIKSLMKKYKLDNTNFSGLRLSSSSCVGFPTCGLAMAESERYLPELITKLENSLEEYGLKHDSIVMRMTGCPNGCARPWLAEIALVGKAPGAYNLMLGGGYYGQRVNKLYRNSITEEEIIDILKPLFKRWALERNNGEHFGDFLVRVGVIKPTLEGKYFHDDVPEDA